MAYDFSEFKKNAQKAEDWLKGEYTGLRTGRATPSILDSVTVEAYGSKMPINQVASISVSDPKSLLVTPWDKSVAAEIDRAIREANLGLSVSMDSNGVRVSFPELTTDRRALLIKAAKEKLEEARIKIRNERQRVLSDVESQDAGEDEEKRVKNELQKLVDEANKRLEELNERKAKEISE
jgi:ribosome recycling factor